MNSNKYFIINTNDANYNEIVNDIVEISDTIRKSLDLTLAVVKLPLGTETIPSVLNSYTCYNHSEIIPLISTSEWQDNNI